MSVELTVLTLAALLQGLQFVLYASRAASCRTVPPVWAARLITISKG